MRATSAWITISLTVIALGGWIAWFDKGLPHVPPEGSSPLSLARMKQDLAQIAVKPHPIGSLEHERVLAYLRQTLDQADIPYEVASRVVIDNHATGAVVAAHVQNLIVRLEGTDPSYTIGLASHYDSVAQGPGAGDAAVSVVALLEVLRLLKNGPRPTNNLVVMFTDGEELGMLGARALLDAHPVLRELDMVFNFEGRGSAGPMTLFETNGTGLIRDWAKAVSNPVGDSFSSEIYQYLPHGTDFSLFKTRDGLQGLNFAHIQDPVSYHTPYDTPDRVSDRTLYHHGQQALEIARFFGNRNTITEAGEPLVYFTLPVLGFISFSTQTNLILMVLTLLLFFGCVGLIHYKNKQAFQNVGRDLIFLPMVFVSMAVVCSGLWAAIKGVLGHLHSFPLDHPFHSLLMLLFASTLTVGTWMRLLMHEKHRDSMEALYLVGAGWGLVFALGLYQSTPLATYVLIVPLLSSLLGLLAYQLLPAGRDTYGLPLLALAQVPGLWLLVPLIHWLFLGLPVSLMAVPLLLLMLLCCLVLAPYRGRVKVGLVSNLLWGLATLALIAFIAVNQSDGAIALRESNQYLVVDQETRKAYQLNAPSPGQAIQVPPKDWKNATSTTLDGTVPHVQATVLADQQRGSTRVLQVALEVPAAIGDYWIYFDRQKLRAIDLGGSVELFHGLIHYLGAKDGRMVFSAELAQGDPFAFRVVFQTTSDALQPPSSSTQKTTNILIHQSSEL